jgi:very-short-patch-repair endonuclease
VSELFDGFTEKKKRSSALEDALFEEFKFFGLPLSERQYIFAPPRKWRADFCWPKERIIVEVEGGLFMPGGGRHNRGVYVERSHEKMNEAVRLGYRCFMFGPKACKAKSGHASQACAFLYDIFRPVKGKTIRDVAVVMTGL